jgi:hypothetical protein
MNITKDDPTFRRWVAQQPCVLTGRTGQNHPHHVKLKSRGGKDPDNVVSLYYVLHDKLHSGKEDVIDFFLNRGIDPFNAAAELSAEYRKLKPGDTCPFGKED